MLRRDLREQVLAAQFADHCLGRRRSDHDRVHALMLLGRVDEARAVYLNFRGQKLENGKSWETVILEDFAELRKAGITHPLMHEIAMH